MSEWTDEERAIIVRARARMKWIDTLEEPQRGLAIAGVPEDEWPAYAWKIAETVALIRGTARRVWRKDLGYWVTEGTDHKGRPRPL